MGTHRRLSRETLQSYRAQLRERRRLRRGGLTVRLIVHGPSDRRDEAVAGVREVYDSLVVESIRSGRRDVQIVLSAGLGPRAEEPLVTVESLLLPPITYRRIDGGTARALFRRHALHGEVLGEHAWLVGWPPVNGDLMPALEDSEGTVEGLGGLPELGTHPWFSGQHRRLLRHLGRLDPRSIEDYLAVGGYGGLERALFELTPTQITVEVTRSGLRGRGADDSPVGERWADRSPGGGAPPVVLCRGAPERSCDARGAGILGADPHAVLEGMAIAAVALDARQGVVRCPGDPETAERVEQAVRQAESLGLLGERILGTGFGLTVSVLQSAEECRAEVAESDPRHVLGHDDETLANLTSLLGLGVEMWRSVGCHGQAGTRLLALGGRLCRSGPVEVPAGVPLRRLVEEIGGGLAEGRPLRAVHVGGTGGGLLPPALLDLPLDPSALSEAGAPLGDGALVAFSAGDDLVAFARLLLGRRFADAVRACPSCRAGALRLLVLLDRIGAGAGSPGDLSRLEEVARGLREYPQCPDCATLPGTVLSLLRHFGGELAERAGKRRLSELSA